MVDLSSIGFIGLPVDKRVIDVGADDFVLDSGFLCTCLAAGEIKFRTLKGSEDLTETKAVGERIETAGIPVPLRIVRGTGDTTTVAQIEIGIMG